MTPFIEQRSVFESPTGEVVMRNFIRHPSDIPIECHTGRTNGRGTPRLKDVGFGGLAFHAKQPVDVGCEITVRIPGIEPELEVAGLVAWCKAEDGEYTVGVQFLDQDASFRARMVEQVCHIEHYKAEVQRNEGRELTGEEAAAEWIARFAKDFPSI